MNYCFC